MLHINIVGIVTCSYITPLTDLSRVAYHWIFFSIHFIITLHSFIAATSASEYKKKLKFNKMLSILVDSAAANEQFVTLLHFLCISIVIIIILLLLLFATM